MKRVLSLRIAAALCVTALALVGCGDDGPTSGDPANTGSVSGTVTFTGTWPVSGDVQVAVYSELPPTRAPDGYTSPLNGATDYPTYDFKIAGLDAGTYAGIIVTWRDPSDTSSSRIIGQYSGGLAVVVVKQQDADGFDITADLSLAGP
jgi:hypothetical protein